MGMADRVVFIVNLHIARYLSTERICNICFVIVGAIVQSKSMQKRFFIYSALSKISFCCESIIKSLSFVRCYKTYRGTRPIESSVPKTVK